MNPLHVKARCYRSFEQLDFEIPAGATVIVGPNGAGKSSLVNLIDVALFAQRGELGSDDVKTLGADDLEIVLTFEHDRELYRVRRCHRGGRTTLDLERNHLRDAADERGERPDSWIPLTRESAEATQAEIERLLGLTRQTFRASAFLRQHDAAAFANANPAARKTMLGEILQLGRFDEWARQLHEQARAVEQQTAAAEARVADRQADLDRLPDLEGKAETLRQVETAAVTELGVAERQLEQALQAAAGAGAAVERVRACEAEHAGAAHAHDAAVAELARARAAVAALPEQTRALDTATRIAATVPALEQQLDAARTAAVARDAALRERADLVAQADRIAGDVARLDRDAGQLSGRAMELHEKADELDAAPLDDRACEACGQPLSTEDARAQLLAGWRTQASELLAEAAAKSGESIAAAAREQELRDQAGAITIPDATDPAPVERDLAAARAAAARLPELEHAAAESRRLTIQLGDLEITEAETADTLAQKQTALEGARATVGDPAKLDQDAIVARRYVEQQRDIIDRARRELATVDAERDRLHTVEQEIAETIDQAARQHARLQQLRLGERAFGRDGIPALIVENAIPAIETEANRMLELMPTAAGTVFRLELRTQRDLKTRDARKETLDVLVHGPRGVRDFSSYSGGEQMRISLAIRAALTRLLAGRRGAESRALIIDEPTGLDADGLAQLPGMLRGLLGEFDRILLASPDPSLRGAFERQIELVNDGGVSRIVAGVPEAVTA